VRLTLLQFTSM